MLHTLSVLGAICSSDFDIWSIADVIVNLEVDNEFFSLQGSPHHSSCLLFNMICIMDT